MTDEFDAIIEGLELAPPGNEEVSLAPHQQAVYLAVEALTQVITSLHATSDVLEILDGEYPDAELILQGGPLPFLYEVGRGGEDRLAVLDVLVRWSEGFAGALAEALGEWMEALGLPEHIHQWVSLPVIGFMPVTVGYGEVNLEMPIPLDFLKPQIDE